jgi:DNA-binding GntR family transcriptional regulator
MGLPPQKLSKSMRSVAVQLSSRAIHRQKSLYEQTYEALRLSILLGELAPGDRLVETQLAQRLQVSRTPIREAIRQLQQDGLITGDGVGVYVTTLSVDDAIHLYDCRLALEQLAVSEACHMGTEEQFQRLEQLVIQAEVLLQNPNMQLTYAQQLEVDYQFHRQIAEASSNAWLVNLLDQVFDKMALLRIQTTRQNPGVLEIRLEHRHIYEAIAQRKSTEAIQAIQAHLTASKHRVVQAIQSLQAISDPNNS